ncbi:uracil-DNA glycosylase family protein [uncultured Muribaculum sp.]|jgi:G:T/U-mismatch repair DNA glycosylase|uniref:uracil-DNA glycosylase family protein n=4 Tax=Muribaculum TaxID=1918540 RepID=UPI00258F75F0|nr:uracil-DNA glycosylase family protein [uncultured Muribaculum sp.]
MYNEIPIEEHPFEPFLPDNAKILIMGTFPPKSQRWSMDFYYPNKINDFWRIIGLIFMSDKNALYDFGKNTFRLDSIKTLLCEKGIALSDTGKAVKRLRDNASDKYLEIVTPIDIDNILSKMPDCHALATTGEKAGQTLADITGTECPAIGKSIQTTLKDGRNVKIYRMPSTSRAYPLALEKKAEIYKQMFHDADIV